MSDSLWPHELQHARPPCLSPTPQGKLEVVKQEMARVNIDILGFSEQRWTGMGEFNSDDHYIYYCGQNSLRRNGVTLKSTKESEMQYLGAISKTTEWSMFISRADCSIWLLQPMNDVGTPSCEIKMRKIWRCICSLANSDQKLQFAPWFQTIIANPSQTSAGVILNSLDSFLHWGLQWCHSLISFSLFSCRFC